MEISNLPKMDWDRVSLYFSRLPDGTNWRPNRNSEGVTEYKFEDPKGPQEHDGLPPTYIIRRDIVDEEPVYSAAFSNRRRVPTDSFGFRVTSPALAELFDKVHKTHS